MHGDLSGWLRIGGSSDKGGVSPALAPYLLDCCIHSVSAAYASTSMICRSADTILRPAIPGFGSLRFVWYKEGKGTAGSPRIWKRFSAPVLLLSTACAYPICAAPQSQSCHFHCSGSQPLILYPYIGRNHRMDGAGLIIAEHLHLTDNFFLQSCGSDDGLTDCSQVVDFGCMGLKNSAVCTALDGMLSMAHGFLS